MSEVEYLSNGALQSLSTHHRANKCTGAAVDTEEKRETQAPKGTSCQLYILLECKARRLCGDRATTRT